MEYFEINGWKLPIEVSLQDCLTDDEKEMGAIATSLNLKYFIDNKPEKNNQEFNKD